MNPQEREQVRLSLLRYGLGRISVGLAVQYLRSEGLMHHKGAEAQSLVKGEIEYLVDKGFLAEAAKVISPENKLWRTTAEGRDLLAEQGIE